MPGGVRIVAGYDYRMAEPATAADTKPARECCCSAYHAAIELIGKRWTGAIVFVLLDGPLRFSEVKTLVPDLSDRLLSERLKELEGEGIVRRRSSEAMPMRIEYVLTEKGRALEPAVRSLKVWARSWL
jgi:DNA-binding HxlR family transcriptional regulator